MMLKIHMLSNRIVCSRLWARGISILHVISIEEQLTRKVNDIAAFSFFMVSSSYENCQDLNRKI